MSQNVEPISSSFEEINTVSGSTVDANGLSQEKPQANDTKAVEETKAGIETGTTLSSGAPIHQFSMEERLAQHRQSQLLREQELTRKRAAIIEEAKKRADMECEKRNIMKLNEDKAKNIKSKILAISKLKAKKEAETKFSLVQSSTIESRMKVIFTLFVAGRTLKLTQILFPALGY
jgi:hypothetical protein